MMVCTKKRAVEKLQVKCGQALYVTMTFGTTSPWGTCHHVRGGNCLGCGQFMANLPYKWE